jgi:predicted Zn finger-like uncharacterized protein
MIIQCQSCSRKFIARDKDIPEEGRLVQCGYCSVTWHQMPVLVQTKVLKEDSPKENIDENLSVDSIKASDGKTYRFLGSQWAQLLPSGKTGIFAKRKIGKELDELTGRKNVSLSKKKYKKGKIKEVDPSSEVEDTSGRLPDIYNPKKGMGFFGYIFLLILITFSIIGVAKVFESDIINYLPEAELYYLILDEQLNHIFETVKNIIVITKDLINSY